MAPSSGEHATQKLADFAVGVTYEALPARLTTQLRASVLDFIAVSAYAAVAADGSAQLRRAVRQLNPEGGEITSIGETGGYAPQYAALLNGTYAHTLDFDDTNQLGLIHPGAVVIPAALAAAEHTDAGGRAFLTALAAGYEVACRVGAGLGKTLYDRGFHPTPIAGILGAAAAAARLLAVDGATFASAFGFCASKAAGSMQFLESGALNKRLHAGFAAHDAWLALALARVGLRGSSGAIEGANGLLAGYSNAPSAALVAAALNERWLAAETAIKPYPSCRFTHAAIDAVLALRQLDAGHARSPVHLRIRLSPGALRIVGERSEQKLRPRGVVDAQFSVFFQAAVAWLEGNADWHSYRRIGDAAVEAMAANVTVEPDSGLALNAAEVRIEGTDRVERIDFPLGEPEHPLDWRHVEAKFASLVGNVFEGPVAAEIARATAALESVSSMRAFARRLRSVR